MHASLNKRNYMNNKIKEAIDVSQRAQRNYDLSKNIPNTDLQTLLYAAGNSPSKQNETHYSLHVYTDQSIIKEIYNCTKLFGLHSKKTVYNSEEEGLYEVRNGKFWQDESKSVHNSQILANALFVYVEDEGEARGGTHMLAKEGAADSSVYRLYQEQKNYSMGISVGQLILSATLLGYKTGICSAINTDDVAKILNITASPKLLVGIGFENSGINRRLHAETLNSDLPERFRTGAPEEKYRFPSFEKTTDIKIN